LAALVLLCFGSVGITAFSRNGTVWLGTIWRRRKSVMPSPSDRAIKVKRDKPRLGCENETFFGRGIGSETIRSIYGGGKILVKIRVYHIDGVTSESYIQMARLH
jgi:hypothetical protein